VVEVSALDPEVIHGRGHRNLENVSLGPLPQQHLDKTLHLAATSAADGYSPALVL